MAVEVFGSFLHLCHWSCAALSSQLLLFSSGSKEKCPCFGTEIYFLLWTLSASSSCFLSVTPFPIFCIAFRVTRVYCSLCKRSIAGRDGSGSRLESICFSQPPVRSEATALQCYQIILFQKLLIKTWVIGQVTKDFSVYLFEQWKIPNSHNLFQLFSVFVPQPFHGHRI